MREQGTRAECLTFDNSLRCLDLKRGAVLAIVGTLGPNNLVATPEHGPPVRFGAVFTDLKVKPDRPLTVPVCLNS